MSTRGYVCYSGGMTQTTTPLGRFGRFGTTFIAYLSLAVGAGLSTAFNVVHTIEVRGAALDAWDVVVAVAGPGMVVLMVELFVSTLWAGQRWYMQLIRWVGCLMVAGIAMRMSWTHGHDFLVSRGQTGDVSALMPLAVDTLAIMATALLLSSRMSVRVPVDTDKPGAVSRVLDTIDQMIVPAPVLPSLSVSLDTPTAAELEDMFSLSDFLPQPTGPVPSPLPVPVSAPPSSDRVVRVLAPSEMDAAVEGLLSAGVPVSEVKASVAEVYGVSTKTVGRRIAGLSA